jgi:hypothetical protein
MRSENSANNGRHNEFANAFTRDGVQAKADTLKRLQAETPVNKNTGHAAAGLDALLPAILRSLRGFDPTSDRVWTYSPPARSGCALLLHRILFAHSQCAQIKREL